MGILAWLLFGLIVGAIAKFIMPGAQGGGWIITIILGIVGAMVGGWIGTLLGIGSDAATFTFSGIAMAVLGAIVVLFIYGALTRGRA
ncbi:GlsB/YeaQ/YmgE family stress response membrane protein [Halpernia sp. GG3]